MDDFAPMVVSVAFFMTVAAVLLLRPITKKLGSYLEVLAEERRRQLSPQPVGRDDVARIASLLEAIDQRLVHLEDRQEFTERLLEKGPAFTNQ